MRHELGECERVDRCGAHAVERRRAHERVGFFARAEKSFALAGAKSRDELLLRRRAVIRFLGVRLLDSIELAPRALFVQCDRELAPRPAREHCSAQPLRNFELHRFAMRRSPIDGGSMLPCQIFHVAFMKSIPAIVAEPPFCSQNVVVFAVES